MQGESWGRGMCGYSLQILRWSRGGHLKGGTAGAIAELGAKELKAERCCQSCVVEACWS